MRRGNIGRKKGKDEEKRKARRNLMRENRVTPREETLKAKREGRGREKEKGRRIMESL